MGCLTSGVDKTQKNDKNFQKVWKNFLQAFFQKNAKIRNVEMLKLFDYHQKLCGNLSSNLRVGCLTSRVEKTQKMTKIFKKVEKICKFFEKNAKFCNVEMLKPFYYH